MFRLTTPEHHMATRQSPLQGNLVRMPQGSTRHSRADPQRARLSYRQFRQR